MKIRYNQDGQVVYFDARELIDKCVEAGLLHMFVLREVTSLRNGVAKESEDVYARYIAMVMKSDDGDGENWELVEYEQAIHMLQTDGPGYIFLVNVLKEEGIAFTPSVSDSVLNFTLYGKN